jgi:hypothetical protein
MPCSYRVTGDVVVPVGLPHLIGGEVMHRQPRGDPAAGALAGHPVDFQHGLLRAGRGLLGAHAHGVSGPRGPPQTQFTADFVDVVATGNRLGIAAAVGSEVTGPPAVGHHPLPQRRPPTAAPHRERHPVQGGVGAGDVLGPGPFDELALRGAPQVTVQDAHLVQLPGRIGLRADLTDESAGVLPAGGECEHEVVGVEVELFRSAGYGQPGCGYG